MTIRTPLAAALAVAALAAAPASAQVVYTSPPCQPVVYYQPVVYHTPVYTSTMPTVYQSGQWVNRPILLSPPSRYPVGRTYRAGRSTNSFGGPFNRPSLNLAYQLAWR